MQVNFHDAKTHLCRYVDQALAGEEVVIARAGKPLVRLIPLMDEQPPRRLGFLAGTARIDADLKGDFEDEINAMFDLGPQSVTEQG
jgi:prevent-host-death family protein